MQQTKCRSGRDTSEPLISDGWTGLPQRPSACCSTAGPGPGPSWPPPPRHLCGTRWGEPVGAAVPAVPAAMGHYRNQTWESKPGEEQLSYFQLFMEISVLLRLFKNITKPRSKRTHEAPHPHAALETFCQAKPPTGQTLHHPLPSSFHSSTF